MSTQVSSRKPRPLIPILALLPLVALSGLVLSGWLALGPIDLSAATPDLRWKDLDVAQALGDRRHVRVQVAGTRLSDTYASRTVVEQYPPPGQPLSRNGVVWVVISRGRQAVVVPDVRGRSLDEASRLLAQGQLAIGRVFTIVDWADWGTVLSQQPAAGTRLAPGSAVRLVVSRGHPLPEVAPVNPEPPSRENPPREPSSMDGPRGVGGN